MVPLSVPSLEAIILIRPWERTMSEDKLLPVSVVCLDNMDSTSFPVSVLYLDIMEAGWVLLRFSLGGVIIADRKGAAS
jgi:hypothetical protein